MSILLRLKRSLDKKRPSPPTTRVDLTGETVPNLSETIHQPALAREAAVHVAGSMLTERQENIRQQLDILRKTRASRGGTGAPLDVPGHLQSEQVVAEGKPVLFDPQGYRIGTSRADMDKA